MPCHNLNTINSYSRQFFGLPLGEPPGFAYLHANNLPSYWQIIIPTNIFKVSRPVFSPEKTGFLLGKLGNFWVAVRSIPRLSSSSPSKRRAVRPRVPRASPREITFRSVLTARHILVVRTSYIGGLLVPRSDLRHQALRARGVAKKAAFAAKNHDPFENPTPTDPPPKNNDPPSEEGGPPLTNYNPMNIKSYRAGKIAVEEKQ